MTVVQCVAKHRRCVADLATSQPYLYEVLGGKADTIDAEHLRHTLYKISHPSRHRSVIVFYSIKKTSGSLPTAARFPETNSSNSFCKAKRNTFYKLLTLLKV